MSQLIESISSQFDKLPPHSMDVQNAVCETYPPSLDPGICSLNKPDDSYGCATRPGPSGGADLAVTATFLAAAVAIGRRRSRSTHTL